MILVSKPHPPKTQLAGTFVYPVVRRGVRRIPEARALSSASKRPSILSSSAPHAGGATIFEDSRPGAERMPDSIFGAAPSAFGVRVEPDRATNAQSPLCVK